MATYQSTHTGAQIDAAVDAVAGKADQSTTYTKTEVDDIVDDYLPLTGGTLSGALTVQNSITTTDSIYLPNTGTIYSKDSDGVARNLLHLSSNNNINLGYGTYNLGTGTYIYGKTINIRVNGTSSSSEAMTIDSSKNVAISGGLSAGGTTFTGVMNITGETGYAEGIRIHPYSGVSSIWFGAVNSTGYDAGMWGITVNSSGMRFRGAASTTATSVNDYINITHGGNVGIGTTSPTKLLDVNGTVQASSTVGETLTLKTTSGTYTCISFQPNNGVNWSVGANAGTFYFWNASAGSTVASIDVNGNVSIAGGLSLGGQSVVSVFSGSTAPSSSTGSNGDIYIQTT